MYSRIMCEICEIVENMKKKGRKLEIEKTRDRDISILELRTKLRQNWEYEFANVKRIENKYVKQPTLRGSVEK